MDVPQVGQRSSEERSLSTDHASKGGHESIQVGSAGRASKARPGRLINANIMAAQTAEELLDVVQQEIDSPKFGLVNAVTALHRLAKVIDHMHCLACSSKYLQQSPMIIQNCNYEWQPDKAQREAFT